MSPRQRFLPALLVALSLLLLVGCGRQGLHPTAAVSPERDAAPPLAARSSPADPGTPTSGRESFFPLEVGNHWRYARVFALNLVLDDGRETGWIHTRTAVDARLVRTGTIGERAYVVEEDVTRDDSGEELGTQRVFWRQDRTGLFEVEVGGGGMASAAGTAAGSGSRAFARARSRAEALVAVSADGVAVRVACDRLERKLALIENAVRAPRQPLGEDPPPLELTCLRYPLHPKAQWDVRTDLLFTAQVEGFEVLNLPAGRFGGWRMRYASERFGPQDQVRVWYGRDGYLALDAYLEGEVVDLQGNRIGTAIGKLTDRLDGIELVGEHGRP
jgi:hypothetical protein